MTAFTAGNIPGTPAVSFEYDAAGNRKRMQDGSGSTDYSYDSLSRLKSETKHLNGLSRALPLGYEYTLDGRLMKLTDPWDGLLIQGFPGSSADSRGC